MLTKTIKIVNQPAEVEVFNLELTKDQIIELAGLLGNCSSADLSDGLYYTIYKAVNENDQDLIGTMCKKFGAAFESVPQLKHL